MAAHFGRCPEYTLVDVADGEVVKREVVENPGHRPGFLPRYLADRDVEMIIAGGMGRRAIGLFDEQGIKTVVGVQCSVDEAIEGYLQGNLETGDSLCEHPEGPGNRC